MNLAIGLTFNILVSNLHVDSVIKNFDTKQVLTDVFISCQKGEIIGLLGRETEWENPTLLKIIFGSLSAESKFVRIGEQNMDRTI